MAGKVRNIPKLRFPEFKDNGKWDKEKIRDIIFTISPLKKLKSSDYLFDGKFPIMDQSQDYYCGYTNDEETLIDNDFPLVIFGDHTCIVKIAQQPFAQGADGIKIIKTEERLNTSFFYQYLKFNPVRPERYKRHFSNLKNKTILYPKNKKEQQKIADCLSSLDDLITAHKEKLDILKDHKKGLLQNLFPQEGEKVPKYRFPEFKKDGDWEEKRLEMIGDPLMCKRVLKKQTVSDSNGAVPFYKIGTFGKEADSYIPEDLYMELKKKYSYPKIGDILISASGTIGRLVIYDGNPAYYQDSNIVWIGNDETQVKNNFLFFAYSVIKWKTSDGGVIKRLYNRDLKELKIKFPKSKKEQQKIAETLSSLDSIIEQQQKKIEELEEHKKGLLQGLFPEMKN